MENKLKIKVENMDGKSGKISNQFRIWTDNGVYFQSYDSVVVFKSHIDGKTYLDEKTWDYSKTTGKYRNQFLRETKKETEQKIKSGLYVFAELN